MWQKVELLKADYLKLELDIKGLKISDVTWFLLPTMSITRTASG